jgi:hypothetical protein
VIRKYAGEEIWQTINDLMFNENTQFEGTKTTCLELIYTIISMMGIRGYYKDIIMHDLKVQSVKPGVVSYM